MNAQAQPQDARTAHDAVTNDDLAHVGRRNTDGLFYAACSRDHDTEICGCPICQDAAHQHDQ